MLNAPPDPPPTNPSGRGPPSVDIDQVHKVVFDVVVECSFLSAVAAEIAAAVRDALRTEIDSLSSDRLWEKARDQSFILIQDKDYNHSLETYSRVFDKVFCRELFKFVRSLVKSETQPWSFEFPQLHSVVVNFAIYLGNTRTEATRHAREISQEFEALRDPIAFSIGYLGWGAVNERCTSIPNLAKQPTGEDAFWKHSLIPLLRRHICAEQPKLYPEEQIFEIEGLPWRDLFPDMQQTELDVLE